MKSAVLEITRISHLLPPRKKAQLLDFARALQSGCKPPPGAKPKHGDDEWERTINDPTPEPKLAAKLKQLERLAAEGKDEPMDWDRL
ncbi:MAG: hypothetical protein ACLQU3_27110 [Limisphaerales bacterium]|jgi:hypothetical protein